MEDSEFLVSIYVPNSNKGTKQMAYIARTEAQVALRDNLKTKYLTRFHSEFADSIENEVNKLKDHKQGIAVFAKFIPDREPLQENIIAVPLPREPEQTRYVGDTYDVTQLLLATEANPQTLVLNIHRDHADIYLLEKGEFTPTASVDNLFAINKDNKEYRQRYNVAGGQTIHHGSGSGTIEKRLDQENLRFINDIEMAVPQLSPLRKKSLANIIIFYSNQFEDHMEEFTETLRKKFNNVTIKTIQKNITSDKEIEKLAKEETKEIADEFKDDLLQEAKETYTLYTEDWDSVRQATREKRIEKLFINPTKAAPDIVHQVLQSGGDVIVIDSPDVAAKLRY